MSVTDTRTASYSTALEWLNEYGLDACELDDRTPVHEALAKIPPSARRDAACLAVRAALERLDGHVDTAVALYEQSLRRKVNRELEVRIREELGNLFLSRRQDAEGERIIAKASVLDPDDPRILSLQAVLRARRRDSRALEDLERLESLLAPLSNLERARLYRRMASATYEIRGDFSTSERYWNLAIEHAEVAGAHCHAAVAYWGLSYLYSTHVGDITRVLKYTELWAQAAAKAGDKGLLLASLVVSWNLAAEIGDKAMLDSLRERLQEAQGPERYAERILMVTGEAMIYGWNGAFDTMRQYLVSVDIGRVINAQKSIYHALTAVAHAGAGYEEQALKSAYRALSLARPLPKEPLHETRIRLTARFLSACVLLRSDRRTEAVRILNAYEARMTPSLVCLRDAVLHQRYEPVRERAPDVYGYALLCQTLEKSSDVGHSTNGLQLTERELGILQAASLGRTSREMAGEMKIGIRTVEWHRNNLLKKLGVKTTLAAIAKGRDLQIIS